MQNLNERGAAYIPIAEARGITPHSYKYSVQRMRRSGTPGRRIFVFTDSVEGRALPEIRYAVRRQQG